MSFFIWFISVYLSLDLYILYPQALYSKISKIWETARSFPLNPFTDILYDQEKRDIRQEAWGLKDHDFKISKSLFGILFIDDSYAGRGPTLEDSLELTMTDFSMQ